MYYDDQALYPENMAPLIITAAPYGPTWLPGDVENMPITWEEQVQAAVDCFNAGATMLHLHVRDPETGHLSADIDHYNYLLGRAAGDRPQTSAEMPIGRTDRTASDRCSVLTLVPCADARKARTPRDAWSARPDGGGAAAGKRPAVGAGRLSRVEMLRDAVAGRQLSPVARTMSDASDIVRLSAEVSADCLTCERAADTSLRKRAM
jgi:hypothetical protein